MTNFRRLFRQLLFSCGKEDISPISGVILFEETLYQKADDGTPFVEVLRSKGIIPGIKVGGPIRDNNICNQRSLY